MRSRTWEETAQCFWKAIGILLDVISLGNQVINVTGQVCLSPVSKGPSDGSLTQTTSRGNDQSNGGHFNE